MNRVRLLTLLGLTFGFSLFAAPPTGALEKELRFEQRRVDRLEKELCVNPESDDCRELGDIEVTLKGIRGEIDESEEPREALLAHRELQGVRQSLDAIDPNPQMVAE
jgi:hypothetical protein